MSAQQKRPSGMTKAELAEENLSLRRRLRELEERLASPGNWEFPRNGLQPRQLFDAAPNPILFLDLDGIIRECNTAAARALGLSVEELVGRNGFELPAFEPDETERLRAMLAEFRESGKLPAPFEVRLRNVTGEFGWYEFHVTAVERDGRPMALTLQSRNITAFKEAERRLRESQEISRLVADSLPVLVAYRDLENRYLFVNREYERWFGPVMGEIPGKRLGEVVGDRNLALLRPHLEKVMRGETVYADQELFTANGAKMLFHARYLPHFADGGEQTGYFIMAEEISARQWVDSRLQEELEANSILADLARSIITAELSIEVVAEKVMEGAKRLTGSEHGFVALVDPLNKDMVAITLTRMMETTCALAGPHSRIRFARGADGNYPDLWGVSFNTRQAMFTNDPAAHPASRGVPPGHVPIRRFLSAPAMVGDELVGEVALANPVREYTDDDLKTVGRLADLFAIAVHRLRTEAALRESESLYRTLYEESPISIWLVDLSEVKRELDRWLAGGMESLENFLDSHPQELERLLSLTRIRNVNQATLTLYGAARREDFQGDFHRFITPESYPVLKDQVMSMAAGKNRFEADMPMFGLNGKPFLIHYSLVIPEMCRDHWENVTVSVIDVTETRKFQEALRKVATEWRETFDAMSDPIMLLNGRREVTRVNRAAAVMLGLEYKQMLGKKCYELLHPDTGPSPRCLHLQTMADGGNHSSEMTRDGRTFRCSTSPLRDDRQNIIGAVHVMNEITELKRIEEERLRSSKLESIGVLAGGIAHDFNNILMGIMGNISMAQLELEDEEDPSESLEAAAKASTMARELTRQLLTFSRGGAPVKKSAPIREVIEEAVKFVTHGSNVRCHLELAHDLGALEIDAGQISQVIHNLVLNAIQAMPEGGAVKVVAEKRPVREGESVALPAGEYVCTAVIDSGAGIAPEVLPNIFDPYFTTKKKGTGLGLATSYSIVNRHGGAITVNSEVGRGSCFTVYLPVGGKGLTNAKPAEPPVMAGTGRVLLMDDEDMVRTVAGRMLARLGYTVTLAGDGAEVVELYRRARDAGAPFHAVIMDLTVPGGMGGRDAVRELIALDPAVRAIVASGYSNDPVMSDCRAFGFAGMVSKPYQMEELGAVLAAVLPPPAPPPKSPG